MDTIKVDKFRVLGIIKTSRKKHKKDYYDAIKAYRVKVGDLMAKELQKVVSGEDFDPYFRVEKPQSHLNEYDLAIQMLEMSVDDVIEIQAHEFNQLVNDEWNWKSQFKSSIYSNSQYVGSSGISGSAGASGTSGTSGGGYSYNVTFSSNEIEDDE